MGLQAGKGAPQKEGPRRRSPRVECFPTHVLHISAEDVAIVSRYARLTVPRLGPGLGSACVLRKRSSAPGSRGGCQHQQSCPPCSGCSHQGFVLAPSVCYAAWISHLAAEEVAVVRTRAQPAGAHWRVGAPVKSLARGCGLPLACKALTHSSAA